jgi:pimeloyl-ACP methyl ester carboxylesterase
VSLVVVLLLVVRVAGQGELRAMSVLTRFSDPKTGGFATSFAAHPVYEADTIAQTQSGPLKVKTYTPTDVANAPGMLLLHGVHHLGMQDPRMVNLARAMASAGFVVATPELHDLTEYHVTPQTVDTIGQSAIWFQQQTHHAVGIVALSFAGGLALMAAARPEYADKMGYVLAVGAHDDMARVARFFATNLMEEPDGTRVPFQAHEYGVLILAYSHLEDFFTSEDVPVARQSLRQRLWETPDPMNTAASLSPAGAGQMKLLVYHREQLEKAFLAVIERHRAEMSAVSPAGRLKSLTMPVYLLHGAGDNIIPPAESRWLAREVPPSELRGLLISRALSHVDVENKVSFRDQWDLIRFMGRVLDEQASLAKH